jgi:catechol 2,3-dioxygenase-like lactoylglutathione lyase family enzyme
MTTTETTIGINGMAHVILTVSQFAAARAFYGRLLPALGMTPVCDTDKLFYCVGARTAIGHPANRAGACWRPLRAKPGWLAPSLPASPFARGRRPLARSASANWGHHNPRPARGSVGAGLLFGAVRGPRRHPSGSKLCPRRWRASTGCKVQSGSGLFDLSLRSQKGPQRAESGHLTRGPSCTVA